MGDDSEGVRLHSFEASMSLPENYISPMQEGDCVKCKEMCLLIGAALQVCAGCCYPRLYLPEVPV